MGVDDFLRAFYGDRNQISWKDVESGEFAGLEKLQPWLDRFRSTQLGSVLPRVTEDGQTTWYAFAKGPQEERLLRDELVAFLGPSHTGYRGQPTPLDPADPIDSVVEAHYPFSIKLPVPTGNRGIVGQLLEVRARLREARPFHTKTTFRPVGSIVRDIHEALRLRRRVALSPLLTELKEGSHLALNNVFFLEILAAGARDEWREAIRLAEHHKLIGVPRPLRVTELLLEGIYRLELAHFEVADDPIGARAWFQAKVRDRFGGLLRSRVGLRGHAAQTCMLLRAITDSPPSGLLADEILAGANSASSTTWMAKLRRLIPPSSNQSPTEATVVAARLAFAAGNLDTCWSLARNLEKTPDQVLLLLKCAWETGSLDWSQTALAEAQGLTDLPGHRLESSINKVRHLIEEETNLGLATQKTITCWQDWAKVISRAEPFPAAAKIAASGASEWPVDEFESPDGLGGFSAAIELVGEPNEGFLRDSLPHLLDALGRVDKLPHTVGQLYDVLFLIVVTDPAPGRTFFASLSDILEMRARVGFSPTVYADYLEALREVIPHTAAPANLDELLGTAEMLLAVPCPLEEARTEVLRSIVFKAAEFGRSIHPVQFPLLIELAQLTGVSSPALERLWAEIGAEKKEDPELWSHLSGTRIALYSLDEAVLGRVRRTLETQVKDIQVLAFHDSGGSSALKSAARNADFFVVSTCSAQHAATDFIDAHRQEGKPTIFPDGKGSTSMLRSLLSVA